MIEAGTVYDFLYLILRNATGTPPPWPAILTTAVRRTTRRVRQFNPPGRARRNVHAHYDLDGRLYSLFLDNDLQYSCAYFEDGVATLDDAQLAKKRHIAAKLALEPGQRVLDIGSGWGGLGLYLAQHADVEVVGVTLSEEQLAVSNRRRRGAAASRIAFTSCCRTTARSRAPSTASSRSACSSTSASTTSAPSSRPAAT